MKLSIKALCFFFLATMLIGCASNPTPDSSYDAKTTATATETEISNDVEKKAERDYSEYFKKIWVSVEDNDRFSYSFRVTKLESGTFIGEFLVNGIAIPPCHEKNYKFSIKEENMYGKINGNNIEFDFEQEEKDYDGNLKIYYKGKITIDFQEEDVAVATIEFSYKDDYYKDLKDKVVSFEPYKITDLDGFIENDKLRVETEFDSWGKGYIVSGMYIGHKAFPSCYLTDLSGNILYNFRAHYQTASKIIEIIIEDFNNDGFTDVKIITNMTYPYDPDYDPNNDPHDDDPDNPHFERLFCQREDGWFYLDLFEIFYK